MHLFLPKGPGKGAMLICVGFLICLVLACIIPSVIAVGVFPSTSGTTGITEGTDFPTTRESPLSLTTIGNPLDYYWNPYYGWDLSYYTNWDYANWDFGLFPVTQYDWLEEPDDTPIPDAASDHWVKLAYFPPGTSAGQPALLSGYVGGRYYNAEITITGKMTAPDEFHDIITIKPQENGIFVWAIPDTLSEVAFYQAIAKVGGVGEKSEIVRTSRISAYEPVASASQIPSSSNGIASSVHNPDYPDESSPAIIAGSEDTIQRITRLTLSADSLRPAVGEEVVLSGRLTDDKGKGVAGVTITIEVPDYGTDFLPLTTTTTDGEGRFSESINTWQGGVVPVRAVYEGDDQYLGSSSNTLTFHASE